MKKGILLPLLSLLLASSFGPHATQAAQAGSEILVVRCHTDGSYDCGGPCNGKYCCW